MADGETATSDLACGAAKEALAMAGREPVDIDLVVTATATPDYIGTPSVSCLVQGRIGAANAAAMDLSAGCSGFIYALETAAALLASGPSRRHALVIGAETMTKFADWEDRATCVLLGDGAGAVVLRKDESSDERRGLLHTVLGADGTGAESLIFRRGGSRSPYKAGETVVKPTVMEMNGRAVYNFAVKAISSTITKLLDEEGITIEEVARIIPHQANARIVQAAAGRLGFPEEKFFLNIEEYANTSAASIPIALDDLNRAGMLKKGDILLTVGFGGGLTFGGNIIKW
jgi:3-oxoacyl-[acyl-carrier-protein] synthase-3